MRPLTRANLRDFMCAALAGLEAGVVGGLVALGWWVLSALVSGQSVWTVPARLGALLYRGFAASDELAAAVAAGIALQIASAGAVGVLFGLAMRGGWNSQRVTLLGLLTGAGWHYAGYEVLMRTAQLAVYAAPPRRVMLVGNLLFGLALGMYRRYLVALQTGRRGAG
jgi:hypothetical protein